MEHAAHINEINSPTVCASVGSDNNINKLSLVGMLLPEKYN
jgi:hypothetical protein